ncbi:BQ5605_C001g00430 [Microbotryum silenes-dioicae]|uniref:Aminopeptidase n=1 Tax=Microbotryum silenes-dioicae TaxID=796604 RepID=A0A2X0M3C2_9BASI|nr:BQ5605_C001g00430 [Microbotryum silenes-dioicae]
MVEGNRFDDSNRLPSSVSTKPHYGPTASAAVCDPTCRPSHYSIRLLTDLEALLYKGASITTLTVHEPVECITLHAASPLVLHESNAFLFSTGSALAQESHAPKRWSDHVEYDGEKAKLFFHGGKIEPAEYKMALRWHGELNGSMKGYYTSTYPRKGGEEGQTHVFACTQFQPTSARRAFPCFDEPHFKAIWQLSMISRVGTTSLSNMHVDHVEIMQDRRRFPSDELLDDDFYFDAKATDQDSTGNIEFDQAKGALGVSKAPSETDQSIVETDWVVVSKAKGWHIMHFHPTPLLSSYLVAFANGQFEYREDHFTSVGMDGRTRDVILRFYATWDQIDKTLLALETTRRLVPKYEQVFDIPFPLLKLDTLVVNDFDLGAMENLGLQMGRTSAYTFDDSKGSSVAARKGVVSITSHEISHTWFGDMVSMDCVRHTYGRMSHDRPPRTYLERPSLLRIRTPRPRIKLDALRSSHPIEVRVPDEAAISQAFDGISYSKGASVLKQLCQWIGEDKFIEGVTIYLKKHLWGNTKTIYLWEGIAKSSGEDVAKVMDNWVNKIGFPYVEVEESVKGLKLTQHRFLSSGDATAEEDETLWHIPLQLLTVDPRTGERKVNRTLLFSDREMEIALPDIEKKIYKLNAESCGVYRVLYPASRLERLGEEAIRPDSSLSLTDRMGLIQDASVLASSGYSESSSFLALANLIAPTEKEYLVFSEISSALSAISSVWWEEDESVLEGLAKLKKRWFAKVAKRLGLDPIEGERLEDVELRALSWSTMASSEDPATIKEFQRRFRPFVESNDSSLIPSNLFLTIFRTCVQHGGAEEFAKALQVIFERLNPVQFSAAVSALCSTLDEKRLQETLEFVLSKQVKTQDVSSFFEWLSMNPLAKRKLWGLLKSNFDALIKRLDGNFQAPYIFGKAFNTFTTDKDADEVEHFFEGKDTHIFQQALDQNIPMLFLSASTQGLEAIRANAAWLRRDRKDLRTWLQKNDHISA